ncbi:MAG TPA: trigger factor [Thermomicrobiaceae bacterium]|nr:trigger factor [Thermomicrobiaceae bacterium]
MKVTVERLPLSSVALDILADEDEFKRAVEKAFRRINQQVRIPGFRPGRAPRPIVEQRIGRDYIVSEANRDLMDDLYKQAVTQEDITPISEPSVDIYQQEPLGFRVEVQVYPEIELGDYTAIRVEPREVTVSDEQVDEAIENLRKTHSLWVPPAEPRQPRAGDQVVLDIDAFEDDEPFQSPVENATFELGEDALFPEIEEAVKQLKPGEQAEFDISFAEDNERLSPEMRGKTLHYKVTLQDVKERELPEVDDEFAKLVNSSFQTVDELRAGLRKQLLQDAALEARGEVVNTAIERLTETSTLEMPPALVERQVELDIERLTQELAREGMSFDEFLRFGQKSREAYTEEIRPDAEQRLRKTMTLETFAKSEGVEVTAEDVEAEITRLTGRAENSEEMRQVYANPYVQRMIGEQLADRKLTDRIIELVTEGVGAVTGEGAEALRELQEPPAAEEPPSAVVEAAEEVEQGEEPVETAAELGAALGASETAEPEPAEAEPAPAKAEPAPPAEQQPAEPVEETKP